MSSDAQTDFHCPDCRQLIRAPADCGQVACPCCQQTVSVPGHEFDVGVAKATAVPVEDDGEVLPSLEDLSASPPIEHIALPDELDQVSTPAAEPAGPISMEEPSNELSSLVDGLLDEANKKSKKHDPFAPIPLEGHEGIGGDDVLGVTCSICDTRVHIKREQIGSNVDCPVCFTKFPAYDPKTRKKVWGRGGLTAPEDRLNESKSRQDPTRPNPTVSAEPASESTIKSSGGGGASAMPDLDELELQPIQDVVAPPVDPLFGNEELILADPIERPTVEVIPGLDASAETLLQPELLDDELIHDVAALPPIEENPVELRPQNPTRPKPHPSGSTTQPAAAKPRRPKGQRPATSRPSATTSVSSRPPSVSSTASPSAPSQPDSRKPRKKSRKELLAEAEAERTRKEAQSGLAASLTADPETQEFPEYQHAALLSATKTMLASPGLWWRVSIGVALMLLGVLMKESALPAGTTIESAGGAGEFATQSFMAILFGWVPYYCGLLFFWFTCSFIFRDAALGHLKVASWKAEGFNEVLSTMSLFGISFFLAGSVAIFTQYLMMPARMLLAPLLLTACFFNREPWGLIATDIFSNMKKLAKQWIACYTWLVALASAGLAAGLLFHFRYVTELYWLDALMSVMGVLINVFITLVFAAIVGWHAGLVVKDLRESA